MRRRTTAAAAGLAVIGLGLSGCGTPKLSGEQVAQQAKTALTQQVGQAPDNITCPEDLEGKVGAKTRCTLTASGTKYGLTATTTKVEGKRVLFHIKVDNQPMK